MIANRWAFPKSARLLTKTDYQTVFDHACKASDNMLIVFARQNGLDTPRLGLAISRRCARRALDRNRIKRALRETFRISRADLPGLDLVVICKPDAVNFPGSVLGASLLTQISKIRQRICAGSS